MRRTESLLLKAGLGSWPNGSASAGTPQAGPPSPSQPVSICTMTQITSIYGHANGWRKLTSTRKLLDRDSLFLLPGPQTFQRRPGQAGAPGKWWGGWRAPLLPAAGAAG